MRKMMKKAIALSLIATMSMSAATIVHAEDKVTLRVLNWGNTDEEKIANDAIARFNEEMVCIKMVFVQNQSAQTDILCLQIIRSLWLVLAVGY